MIRTLLFIVATLAILAGTPDACLAQEVVHWPEFEVNDNFRGSGHYFSWLKLSLIWLVFLVWVRSTGWISQDAQAMRARVKLWIPMVVGIFIGALGLMWIISSFSAGFSLLLAAYVAPLATYVGVRNRGIPPEQRVLTPSHLRVWFSDKLSVIGLGTRSKVELTPVHLVKLHARCGKTQAANAAISSGVVTLPGYDATGNLLGDLLTHRAQAVMMDIQADEVALRYLIDGVWHNIAPRNRELVSPIVDVVRSICTGDPTGKKATPRGSFDFVIREEEYVCVVTQHKEQGVYRMVLKVDVPRCPFDSLEALGMHPKMAEQLRERIGRKNHMILISSLPGGGLSTTLDTILEGTDRIRTDCAVIESAESVERDVDATEIHKFSAEVSSAQLLAKVVQSWPDVLVVRETTDTETARLLCRQAREDGVVISAIAAKSSIEALLRVLMLKVPAKEFSDVVSCVVYQRLIRRLCEHCKVPFEPSAKLLQQLGLPKDRVKTLYHPPQSSETVCPECRGIGYRGRTALFEMLALDDAIRDLLISKPSLEGLRTLAQQKGMHSIRDFGAVLVARGETSVEELSRILKQ